MIATTDERLGKLNTATMLIMFERGQQSSDKGRFLFAGHGLLAGLAQAFGAFSTWNAHMIYKHLQESADPSVVIEVQPYLQSLESEAAAEMPEFKVKPNLENEQIWRIRFIDDLALLGRREGAQVTGKLKL